MKTQDNYKEEFKLALEELCLRQEANIGKLKMIWMIITGSNLNGIPKHPRAEFDYPSSASEVADYCDGILKRMLLESVFSSIITDINAVIGLLPTLRTAILAAQTGTSGKVTERNTAQGNLVDGMSDMLHQANKAGRSLSPADAVSLYERLGLKLYTREASTSEDIEIFHGKLSGSFDLYVRTPVGRFAVIWEMSTDMVNWKTADFSHKSHGFVDGLIKKTTYYFRAKISTPKGKTDWSQIIEIICL